MDVDGPVVEAAAAPAAVGGDAEANAKKREMDEKVAELDKKIEEQRKKVESQINPGLKKRFADQLKKLEAQRAELAAP